MPVGYRQMYLGHLPLFDVSVVKLEELLVWSCCADRDEIPICLWSSTVNAVWVHGWSLEVAVTTRSVLKWHSASPMTIEV